MSQSKKLSTKKKIYKHSLSESQIQSKLINYLRIKYPDAFIVKLSDKWQSGLPDLLMILKGTAYFYEVKSEKGKPTPIQLETHKALRLAGAMVSISYGLTQGIDEGVSKI